MASPPPSLRPLTDAVDAAVDALVASSLRDRSATELEQLVRSVARTGTRLSGVTARAVAAASECGAAHDAGASSPRAWLAAATGATPRAAGHAETLADAMASSPALAGAVDAGTLGDEQVRSIAGAVRRGALAADAVDDLVHAGATTSAGATAREVRAREARADQDRLRRDERWARERRGVHRWRQEDGSLEGSFRLDPVAGAVFSTALSAFEQPDAADTPDDQRRTPTQRRADALTSMAKAALDAGSAGTVRSVRPHVTVVVPLEALCPDLTDAVADGAVGELDDGTPISPHAVRTILCDASVRRLVVDPRGRPLGVGRTTRTWSGAQRAASRAVDGGCRGPACDRPFDWTDLHHIHWWSKGGETDLDVGAPLCRHCHALVHDAGWQLQLSPETRVITWTSPTGRTVVTRPRGPAAPRPPPVGSEPAVEHPRSALSTST